MNQAQADGVSPRDTLKILVATDIHLGYMEKDGVRGKDAMNTFEEVLQLGVKNEVDFVLLGGDLFHENKPSRNCLQGTLELLRRYCMGDKPCEVEFLSDPSVNFGHTAFPTVNYTDPNFNISMPVFSIHGNHDDPAGQGNYCVLDMLHAVGLMNYFGKSLSLDAIEMSPLLMEKGNTRLALYGLGSLRDERLHRLFRNKAVKMLRPREHPNDWFNLLVLHQNRAQHGATNYIPEQFLDEFLDLVIWGHEHECLIDPAENVAKNFYVTQPGSTVATSLSEGETREKHCGLLLVNKKDFKIKKLRLETVRQFYMTDVVLSETSINPGDPDATRKIESYCTEKVQQLINKADSERLRNQRQPAKPLIRLRVDYSGGFDPFSIHRFGQKFLDHVANPKDIVLFHRRRNIVTGDQKSVKEDGSDKVSMDMRAENLDSTRVEDMVREYFFKADKIKQLQLLTERGLSDAVKEFVDKEERDAIPELVKYQLTKTQEYLRKRNTSEDNIEAEVLRFKEERRKNVKQEEAEVQEAIVRARANRPRDPGSDNEEMEVEQSDDGEEGVNSNNNASVVRGRGRGRGSRGTARGSGVDGTQQRGRGRGSRGGTRGSAVEKTDKRGAKSIKDAFSAVNSSRATSTSSKSFASRGSGSSEDDECTIVDSASDDEMFASKSMASAPSRSRALDKSSVSKSTSYSARKTGRMGVNFSDEDDRPNQEDEFDRGIPQRKRKR